MLFKSLSAAVFGIDAYLVEVEVDVGSGNLHDFNVVGLPDVAVKESRERIKAALKNCGYDFPAPQSVTINLAPADIRKEGSAFDLPMALGILGCVGTFFGKALNSFVFLGGRMVGMRLASMVLPAPGGPMKMMLWPPAQATSRARLAACWPRTSRRSTKYWAASAGRARAAKRNGRKDSRALIRSPPCRSEP